MAVEIAFERQKKKPTVPESWVGHGPRGPPCCAGPVIITIFLPEFDTKVDNNNQALTNL